MKKTAVLFLAVVMISLVACSKGNNEVDDLTNQVEQEQEQTDKDDLKQEDAKKDDWPDNEFTALIPKPEFSFLAASVSGSTFSSNFAGATIEQVRDYVAKLQEAGFNVNAEVQDEEIYGMVTYDYKASNAEGYSIHIYYGNESFSITMNK